MSLFSHLFRAPDLYELRQNKDFKGLVKALRYKAKASVREDAARSLREFGSKSVKPLIRALKDPEPDVRCSAALALENIFYKHKDVSAFTPLIECLNDDDSSVQGCAALALGELGDRRAIEPVARLLAAQPIPDSQQETNYRLTSARDYAAKVLKQFGDPRGSEALDAIMAAKIERENAERSKRLAEEQKLVDSVVNLTDADILYVLESLCAAYKLSDQKTIAMMEPRATAIGLALNRRGGLAEMKRIFAELNGTPGSRTLEMHWSGIGDWR